MLNTEAMTIAWSGDAARVATRVAIAFDASCSPFVVANASASSTAIASPRSIEQSLGDRSQRKAWLVVEVPRVAAFRASSEPCASPPPSSTMTARS